MADCKHSGRRMFLKGMGGICFGLPLLEYTHGLAWAQADNVGKRFVTVFSHGGTIHPRTNAANGHAEDGNGSHIGLDWWRPPSAAETLTALGPVMQPLEPHRDKLLVVRGVDNAVGYNLGTYGGGHGSCNVSILTAARISESGDDWTAHGPSIDQVIAQRLGARLGGRTTPIHLEIRGHQYGTPFFKSANQISSGEQNPRSAFNAIFAGVSSDEGGPDPAVIKQLAMRGSVLDGVLEGFGQFRKRLGVKDQEIIDAHMDHVRTLEREIEQAEIPSTAQCVVPGQPANIDEPGDVVGRLHVEIILAALRCGLTHVANLEISDILTPWAPSGPQLEVAFGIGHALHHMARDVGPTGSDSHLAEQWKTEMLENRQWRMSLVKQLLDGLDDPTFAEGGRTMLDNSVVLYTSEFSNGPAHNAKDGLVLLAGSAGGYFRTGRHINYNKKAVSDPNTLAYETDAATNNLYTSLLNAFGENDSDFGASENAFRTGALSELR